MSMQFGSIQSRSVFSDLSKKLKFTEFPTGKLHLLYLLVCLQLHISPSLENISFKDKIDSALCENI